VTPEYDFFPLVQGRALEYATRTPDGSGSLRVETLRVASRPGRVEATCRRTAREPGEPAATREFTAVVDGDAVRSGGEIEFPLPGLVGQKWTRSPREYEIESLDGVAETPAGRYAPCIVVRYLIGGGDAGFGRRYYAPNVGFVLETCADEADPFEVSLLRVEEPQP
jgi:hypothetical protein